MNHTMYSWFLLFCVCFGVIWAQNEVEVQKLVNEIDEFIKSTINYQYPRDNSAYAKGYSKDKGCKNGRTYDFIIVGAGSSGTVLANRLSEINDWEILLLEAGGEETNITDIPSMFNYLRLSDFNWGYKSTTQNQSLLGYIDHSEIIPRGKVMGGSSTLNAMMYVRGNRLDYDKWEGEGNPGWSYEDVLPYFKKSEHVNFSNPDPGYHGKNGTLNVEHIDILSPLSLAYIEANKELGRKVLDYNGKDENGVSILQVTEINGKRASGAKAFIKPVRNRTNLKILTNSLVTKIIIPSKKSKTQKDKFAEGVHYLKDGQLYTAKARKEVILAAGGINSPQLLMLSGIGPEKHLKKLGIKVKKNLPGVGENMWDHICLAQQPFTTNYTSPNLSLEDQVKQYLNGKGQLTSADAIQNIGFVHQLNEQNAVPDMEFIFRSSVIPNQTYRFYQQAFDMTEETYNYYVVPQIGLTTWSTYAVLLHPKSRGNIRLKSKNPLKFPLINPNYFSDPEQIDLKEFVLAIKDMIKVSNTKAMQKYDSKILLADLPGCRKYEKGSDEYFECIIRHLASTLHHWSGTCKMGPKLDKMAVVDNNCKVYGIKKLRVVDCSIIPVTISGHTNAVAYMVAEKIADSIKQQYGKL